MSNVSKIQEAQDQLKTKWEKECFENFLFGWMAGLLEEQELQDAIKAAKNYAECK